MHDLVYTISIIWLVEAIIRLVVYIFMWIMLIVDAVISGRSCSENSRPCEATHKTKDNTEDKGRAKNSGEEEKTGLFKRFWNGFVDFFKGLPDRFLVLIGKKAKDRDIYNASDSTMGSSERNTPQAHESEPSRLGYSNRGRSDASAPPAYDTAVHQQQQYPPPASAPPAYDIVAPQQQQYPPPAYDTVVHHQQQQSPPPTYGFVVQDVNPQQTANGFSCYTP